MPERRNELSLERAQGCLLGQLAGDALGSMVEFERGDEIQWRYPSGLREIGPSPVWGTRAGQPTDDSELALGLARALVTMDDYDAERIGGVYVDWLESRPFDIGGTISQATVSMSIARRAGRSLVAAAQENAYWQSEANGALMRQSPLAIWAHATDATLLADWVHQDTMLTHPNRVCRDASAACIVAMAGAITAGLDAEEAYAAACFWDKTHGESPTVSAALANARHSRPSYGVNAGHVLVALQNAFFQALYAPSLEEGIVNTVMGGGDTDTNGAIAGALLGAIHGAEAIPEQWRDAVVNCRPDKGSPRPRPETYWPTDALALAERLWQRGRALSQQDGKGH